MCRCRASNCSTRCVPPLKLHSLAVPPGNFPFLRPPPLLALQIQARIAPTEGREWPNRDSWSLLFAARK